MIPPTDLPPDSYLARFDTGWIANDGLWWIVNDDGSLEWAQMTEPELAWHHNHTQEAP